MRELEDPGVDPSLIKQQIEAAEVQRALIETHTCCFFIYYSTHSDFFLKLFQAIKAETDGLREELEFVRTLGADLIFACGETEKPEVKKTIDEVTNQCRVPTDASKCIKMESCASC